MYSFFVLGIIPGTNIQITFQGFMDGLIVVLCLTTLAVVFWRNHRAIRRVASSTLSELSEFVATPRQPLHATQLHQRA